MNRISLLLLISLAVLCGCAHTYVLTLDNGKRITTASKPKLQNGTYVFKDAMGRPTSIPVSRVREVAPASMVKEEKAMFNTQPQTK